MKRYTYLVLLLLLLAASFLAGSWSGQPQATGGEDRVAGRRILHYVDPMNPAHTSDKPGIAPCGMKMEPVFAEEGTPGQSAGTIASMTPGMVKISPDKQQIIGVRVATADRAPWKDTIRVSGRVIPDETRIYRINAATDGWVKKMLPLTTGSLVKKDDLLATFYAPEFFSAMKAYLYGLKSYDRFQANSADTKEQLELTDANIENYRNALRNLGMSDHQLDEIRRTRQGGDQVEIRAPAAGFLLTRNITLGERFQRGTEVYRIADLSRVWIVADIFENESQYFRPGVSVRVTHPTQHRSFSARISEVLPQFDPATRTLKIRLEADNPGYALRPDMFVDVEFPVTIPSTLAVPSDAVLDSGVKKTVFVDRGNGFFEPRQVKTGRRLGDKVEITGGLMPGERIVVSGNFLIDSESRMRMAAAGAQKVSRNPPAQQHPKDPVCGREVEEAPARDHSLTANHLGKTYYFCTDDCKRQFVGNPGNYVANMASATSAGSLAAHSR